MLTLPLVCTCKRWLVHTSKRGKIWYQIYRLLFQNWDLWLFACQNPLPFQNPRDQSMGYCSKKILQIKPCIYLKENPVVKNTQLNQTWWSSTHPAASSKYLLVLGSCNRAQAYGRNNLWKASCILCFATLLPWLVTELWRKLSRQIKVQFLKGSHPILLTKCALLDLSCFFLSPHHFWESIPALWDQQGRAG